MQEIEAKFYVSDLGNIRKRLRKLRARLVRRRTYELNLRFDTQDASLRREDRVLRLRQDNHAHLAYKGPGSRKSGILSRTEIEFQVQDFDSAKSFLESLGYEKLVAYEKFRTIYTLGNTRIMLDELPYGTFVEIEGGQIKQIRSVGNDLGLNWGTAVESSYLALFDRLCKNRKLKFKELTFKNFRRLKVSPHELSVVPADQ